MGLRKAFGIDKFQLMPLRLMPLIDQVPEEHRKIKIIKLLIDIDLQSNRVSNEGSPAESASTVWSP